MSAISTHLARAQSALVYRHINNALPKPYGGPEVVLTKFEIIRVRPTRNNQLPAVIILSFTSKSLKRTSTSSRSTTFISSEAHKSTSIKPHIRAPILTTLRELVVLRSGRSIWPIVVCCTSNNWLLYFINIFSLPTTRPPQLLFVGSI